MAAHSRSWQDSRLVKPSSSALRTSTSGLDCYWVGSLDFSFLENNGFFQLNPQKVKLFARGSTATKWQTTLVGSFLFGHTAVHLCVPQDPTLISTWKADSRELREKNGPSMAAGITVNFACHTQCIQPPQQQVTSCCPFSVQRAVPPATHYKGRWTVGQVLTLVRATAIQ